jgi:uncharacterized protein (TIGR01777 family)
VNKKILISGASGLVGSLLKVTLQGAGYECFSLVRRTPKDQNEIEWHPDAGKIGKLPENLFGVINLAGENIAGGLWTISRKDKIWRSRVDSTRVLVKACRALPVMPEVFISASGIGVYKDYGDQEIREDGLVGEGFLAHLASAWEAEAHKAEPEMRVVVLRIGMVISKQGGALAKMALPFSLGLGGILGTGKQFMSWIHLEDLIRVIKFSLETKSINGPVNAVAPRPVTNYEFTKTLGRVLRRPTILPAPAWALKFVLGGLAEELLLLSNRAIPAKLQAAGFKFNFPGIEGAFRAELN